LPRMNLRKLLIKKGATRRRKDIPLGNFYHAALYDLLQSSPPHWDKIATTKYFKAAIVRLYTARLRHRNIELQDTDALLTERTTLLTDMTSAEEGKMHYYLRTRTGQWNTMTDDEGNSECIQDIRTTHIQPPTSCRRDQ
jgi:hypothetical protein